MSDKELLRKALIELMEEVEKTLPELIVAMPNSKAVRNLSDALRVAEQASHQKFSPVLCGRCNQRLDLHVVRLNYQGAAAAYHYPNPNDHPAEISLINCAEKF